MVLMHDLVEIDAGDVFVYAPARSEQSAKEEAAADRIFGLLPSDQRQEYLEIWQEFERKETIESKFANALDRIEPLLQNYKNRGQSWIENEIPIQSVLARNQPIVEGSKFLWERISEILEECIALGYLRHEYPKSS
jgi:putative hydrolase of HD superfamily